MFTIFRAIAEKNYDHAVESPVAHTSVVYVYAAGFGLLVGALARKAGERDLKNKKDAFTRKWS